MGGGSKNEVTNAVCTDTAPLYLDSRYLDASIISGSLVKFVKLPAIVSRTEWIASHGRQHQIN